MNARFKFSHGLIGCVVLLSTACSDHSELKAGINAWCLDEVDYEFRTGAAPAGLNLSSYCDCTSTQVVENSSAAEKQWFEENLPNLTGAGMSSMDESLMVSLENTFAQSSKTCGWEQR